MKSLLRSMLVLAVTVCALSGVATASASASSYEYIAAGKTVSTSVGVTGTRGASKLTFRLPGGPKLDAKCTGGSSSGKLEKEGKSYDEVTLAGCGTLKEVKESGEEVELKGCTVGNAGLAGSGTIVKNGSAIENQLTGVLGNFAIEGTECALRKSKNLIEGSVKCAVAGAEGEWVEHEVRCEPGEGSLSVDGSSATMETVEAVKSSGESAGKKWSVRPAGYKSPEHGFRVEGKELTTSVGFAGTRGATKISGTILGQGIVIHCTGGASTGTLEGKGLSAGEGTITGCSVWEAEEGKEIELPKCTVATITFSDKGTLVTQGYGLGDEFVPASESFASFKIKGSECAIAKAAAYKLEGRFSGGLQEGTREIETEKLEHTVNCNPKEEAQPLLTLGGNPATIESTESVKLTGTSEGKKWSAR
jgi:hypothetical protein